MLPRFRPREPHRDDATRGAVTTWQAHGWQPQACSGSRCHRAFLEVGEYCDAKALASIKRDQMRRGLRRVERQFRAAASERPMLGEGEHQLPDSPVLIRVIDTELANAGDVVSAIKLAGGVPIACVQGHRSDDPAIARRYVTCSPQRSANESPLPSGPHACNRAPTLPAAQTTDAASPLACVHYHNIRLFRSGARRDRLCHRAEY